MPTDTTHDTEQDAKGDEQAAKKRPRTAVPDAKRGTFFVVAPEDLVIIDDPTHPLYDKREALPLDDDYVESIVEFGVRKIIDVRKNGDRLEVVDGRRRTRGAVEANKRRAKRGLPALSVRVVLEKGSDEEMDLLMVLGNRGRVDDDPVTTAEKAARLVSKVGEERTALALCTNVRTLRSMLKLLDLAPEVRTSVQAGEVSYSAATKLADLPREDQVAALAEAQASGDQGATKASVAEAVERKRSPQKTAAKKRFEDTRAKLLDVAILWEKDEAKLEDVKQACLEFAAAARSASKKKGGKK